MRSTVGLRGRADVVYGDGHEQDTQPDIGISGAQPPSSSKRDSSPRIVDSLWVERMCASDGFPPRGQLGCDSYVLCPMSYISYIQYYGRRTDVALSSTRGGSARLRHCQSTPESPQKRTTYTARRESAVVDKGVCSRGSGWRLVEERAAHWWIGGWW